MRLVCSLVARGPADYGAGWESRDSKHRIQATQKPTTPYVHENRGVQGTQ